MSCALPNILLHGKASDAESTYYYKIMGKIDAKGTYVL